MDEVSKAKFAEICSKDISSLTEADKVFLKARQSYLGKEGRKRFAGILDGNDTLPVTPEPDETPRSELFEHPADVVSNEQTELEVDEDDDEAEG